MQKRLVRASHREGTDQMSNFIEGNDLSNILRGDRGSDLIYGYAGDDVLFGGRGDDHLIGFEGSDTLFGGCGRDNFVFDPSQPGIDFIQDFNPKKDMITIFNSEGPVDHVSYNGRSGAIRVDGEIVAVADARLKVTDADFHIVFS